MAEIDQPIGTGTGEARHGQARGQIDAALRARREGRGDEADRLLAEARRVDPEAVAAALAGGPSLADPESAGTASDEEVAAISREVRPGEAAPSRAGITGSGSGADA